jgi:GTP cyclohydrolase I
MIMTAFLQYAKAVHSPDDATLIIDDIIDSGATYHRYQRSHPSILFKAMYAKHDPSTTVKGWLIFPWEVETGPEDAVIRLLQYIGEDPNRDGLIETPKRVLKAWKEMTEGYGQDPSIILEKTFDATYNELVLLENINFSSLCEHHCLPFHGTATVGYIPNGRVVGISKLARLVEMFAKRLQIQERMTEQIAEALVENLKPLGVGVIIRAHHQCMGCRGVKQPDAVMKTCCLRGVFLEENAARAEFLGLK